MFVRQLLVVAWMMLIPSLAFAENVCDPDSRDCAPAQLPEPETLALLGVGAVALFIARRRDKK